MHWRTEYLIEGGGYRTALSRRGVFLDASAVPMARPAHGPVGHLVLRRKP